MSTMPVVFAYGTLEAQDVLAQWRELSPGTRQMLILLAAIGLALAWVAVWVLFFRKPHRRHHRHHRGRHSSRTSASEGAAAQSDDGSSHTHKRVKWRRPRRDHRPRNPTLAETGGLPPARTGDPPEILP